MKLKNKVLWVFAGGILLVLLLFLEQQFFQTRKKQIAVILSEDAVSDFCAFQEGIYDGAEDCAVSLRIIHTPELSENAWAELLSAQKKQGCDGVLLFRPEQYYTGSEKFYTETLEQCKIPVFSVTYAPAFFHGWHGTALRDPIPANPRGSTGCVRNCRRYHAGKECANCGVCGAVSETK